MPLKSRTLKHLGLAASTLAFATHCVAAQITVQVNDAKGQPVADAVVYANTISGAAPIRPKREVLIEQIDREFVPLVSVIQAGTMVNFPNRDKVRHHVYSFSPAKTFEIKLFSGVPGKPVMFEKAGEVVLGCNVHDSMIAYLLVVDTSIFSKTDKRGTAPLDGLPAGEYEVFMWYHGTAASALPVKQKIKLTANQTSALTFTFTPKPSIPAAPKPKQGNEIY